MELINPEGRSHRTALVVDGDAYDANSTYAERVRRHLESVNGSNIKTDVFVKRGDTITRCPNGTVEIPVPEVVVDDTDPVDLLTAAGYTQIMLSVAGK